MRHSLFALLIFAASCRSPAPVAVANSQEAARSPTSPIEAKWTVHEVGATSAKLSFTLTKAIATEKDVSVVLVVPAGATLEPSTSRWLIPAAQTGDIVASIDVRWSTLPVDDLQAVIDMQGVSMGFHAVVPYRFGRPEPKVVAPPHDTPNVRVGNSNIGSPVDLTKK